MKKTIEKRGRKKLPKSEKKEKIYILVKGKYIKKAQEEINLIQDHYNSLP